MTELLSFSRTPEQFTKYAEQGILNQIERGYMTAADADLIREFVSTMRVEHNISDARAYKITNALSNITRFIKTPFLQNTIADVNNGVLKILSGERVSGKNQKKTGPLTQNTKRDYIVFLKRLYLWAIEEGYCNLPADKIRRIKPPKPERVTKTAEQMITPDEVLQMIAACNGATAIRDKAILSVLYESGVRINELGNLQWSDVKFEGKFIKINVCSKTGIPRYIPLITSNAYLSNWRSVYPDGEPTGNKPVFVTTTTRSENRRDPAAKRTVTYHNLTYNYLRKHIADIAKRAGIQKNVSCHIWRHSRVTGLLQEGFSESIIKKMMWGSLTSEMLANYGHLCNNDIDVAVARAAGIELEGHDQADTAFKSRICPNCHYSNAPTADYCQVCGSPLNDAAVAKEQDAKEEIHNDSQYLAMLKDLQEKYNILSAYVQKVNGSLPGTVAEQK